MDATEFGEDDRRDIAFADDALAYNAQAMIWTMCRLEW